jgi:hypothetical protein
VLGSCELGNEPSASIKCGDFSWPSKGLSACQGSTLLFGIIYIVSVIKGFRTNGFVFILLNAKGSSATWKGTVPHWRYPINSYQHKMHFNALLQLLAQIII